MLFTVLAGEIGTGADTKITGPVYKGSLDGR